MAGQVGEGHGLAVDTLATAVVGAGEVFGVPYVELPGDDCSCSNLAACTNACIFCPLCGCCQGSLICECA